MKTVLIYLFLLLAVLVSPQLLHAQLLDRVVAVVNNEIITESDIKKFSNKLARNGLIDELLLIDKTPAELRKDRTAQLNFLISEKLIESEIKRLNLSVTIERVEQEVRSIARRNQVSRAEMIAQVKSQGMSVSEYQDFVKGQIERQSLIESEISSKVRISDEDVMAEYLKQNSGINTAFEYTLSHILFLPKKGGAQAALDRAKQVLAKLKAGESFEQLAQQYSEDPNFAASGLLGTFKSGDFQKELEDAVVKLNPGDTTNVVKSRFGYHILKVNNKKIVPDPKFEAAKERIRAQLFEKAFKKYFAVWLENKKAESFVRINE